jgi:hypothetical protein
MVSARQMQAVEGGSGMRMSKAEQTFKDRYPFAHARLTGGRVGRYEVVAVFAGDYLCSEGLTRAMAFEKALEYDNAGIIQPDPLEERTEIAA